MSLKNDITTIEEKVVTPSSNYTSGAKSINFILNVEVDLHTNQGHNPLLVEANTGVIAPYVASDLATFYEACFVQTNTNIALITLATTLLHINIYKGVNLVPNTICYDMDRYHPIVVKLNFP